MILVRLVLDGAGIQAWCLPAGGGSYTGASMVLVCICAKAFAGVMPCNRDWGLDIFAWGFC